MLSWERLSQALCDVWNVFAVVRAANASRPQRPQPRDGPPRIALRAWPSVPHRAALCDARRVAYRVCNCDCPSHAHRICKTSRTRPRGALGVPPTGTALPHALATTCSANVRAGSSLSKVRHTR
jgi:hypothetical protein